MFEIKDYYSGRVYATVQAESPRGALDAFAVWAGFVPYPELERESGHEWISTLEDGQLVATFTNTSIVAEPTGRPAWTRDEIVAEIAAAIKKSVRLWEEGRCTSPSERDYVIDAREILERRVPLFHGTTEEGEEFVADQIYEDAGEKYVTAEDLAEFLYDQLTAE